MTRKVRVAFVDAGYNSFYGAQRSLFTLVANLRSSDIEPIVLLPREGILAQEYRRESIEVAVLPLDEKVAAFGTRLMQSPFLVKVESVLRLIRYNYRVASWIRDERIDLVYANSARAVLYVALAAKLQSKPLLWYVRQDGNPSLLTEIAVRMADRVILIADGVKGIFSERDLRAYRHKFVTLHTGFSFSITGDTAVDRRDIRKRFNIPSDALVLGLVGSVSHRKGHDLLVRAGERLLAVGVDCHLIFVGDASAGGPEYRQLVEALVNEKHMNGRVHWVGYQREVSAYYQAMNMLVLPSRSEGLPRVVIEALAAGLPVVATDVGGVADIIVSPELGRVVKPESVDALTAAIMDILRDPDYLSSKNRMLRSESVRRRFSLDAYVRGFIDIVADHIS